MNTLKKLLENLYYAAFAIIGILSIPWLFSGGARRPQYLPDYVPTVNCRPQLSPDNVPTVNCAPDPHTVFILILSIMLVVVILAVVFITSMVIQHKAVTRESELRHMINFYGWERYLEKLNAKVLCADAYGTLYRKRFISGEALAILSVKNSTAEADGTFKTYYLRVPPTIQTAREAVAWTFSIEPNLYNPTRES
jgi:hypothetical protein